MLAWKMARKGKVESSKVRLPKVSIKITVTRANIRLKAPKPREYYILIVSIPSSWKTY
jgi:hypothetical protein